MAAKTISRVRGEPILPPDKCLVFRIKDDKGRVYEEWQGELSNNLGMPTILSYLTEFIGDESAGVTIRYVKTAPGKREFVGIDDLRLPQREMPAGLKVYRCDIGIEQVIIGLEKFKSD